METPHSWMADQRGSSVEWFCLFSGSRAFRKRAASAAFTSLIVREMGAVPPKRRAGKTGQPVAFSTNFSADRGCSLSSPAEIQIPGNAPFVANGWCSKRSACELGKMEPRKLPKLLGSGVGGV